MGTLQEDLCLFLMISILLRMRYIPDKSVRENQNTHFIFSNFILKVLLFIIYCGKIR
jgi:hypothetical protein